MSFRPLDDDDPNDFRPMISVTLVRWKRTAKGYTELAHVDSSWRPDTDLAADAQFNALSCSPAVMRMKRLAELVAIADHCNAEVRALLGRLATMQEGTPEWLEASQRLGLTQERIRAAVEESMGILCTMGALPPESQPTKP